MAFPIPPPALSLGLPKPYKALLIKLVDKYNNSDNYNNFYDLNNWDD